MMCPGYNSVRNAFLAVVLCIFAPAPAMSNDVVLPESAYITEYPFSLPSAFQVLDSQEGILKREDLVGTWTIVAFWSPEEGLTVENIPRAIELQEVVGDAARVMMVNVGDLSGAPISTEDTVDFLVGRGFSHADAIKGARYSDNTLQSIMSVALKGSNTVTYINPEGVVVARFNTLLSSEEPWSVRDAEAVLMYLTDSSDVAVEEDDAPADAAIAIPEDLTPLDHFQLSDAALQVWSIGERQVVLVPGCIVNIVLPLETDNGPDDLFVNLEFSFESGVELSSMSLAGPTYEKISEELNLNRMTMSFSQFSATDGWVRAKAEAYRFFDRELSETFLFRSNLGVSTVRRMSASDPSLSLLRAVLHAPEAIGSSLTTVKLSEFAYGEDEEVMFETTYAPHPRDYTDTASTYLSEVVERVQSGTCN